MDFLPESLALLLPNISAELRTALANIYLGAASIAPPDARDCDAALDAKAALLYQGYFQLLRLSNNLSLYCMDNTAAQPHDCDVVALAANICQCT